MMEPRYPGDARFRELLIQAGNPFTLEEARAAIAGAILAEEMVPPSEILEILYENNEDSGGPELGTEADAQDFVGAFMGLWNELTKHQDPELPFAFAPLPKALDTKDIQALLRVASLRAAEVSCFLVALIAGNTSFGDDRGPEHAEELLESLPLTLEKSMGLLQNYIDSIESGKTDQASMVVPTIEVMDERMRELYPKFISQTMAARLASMAVASVYEEDGPMAPAFNPLKDVGRNDPCPCGSGFKYKRCCLH